jgi:putative acyl-CoA dehydrogenase
LIAEALECLGGNGYVEESPLPRLYRDAPLNSLWEGAGNIQCLDVLRSIDRDPDVLDALRGELAAAAGSNRVYDRFCRSLENATETNSEYTARTLVTRYALALQASLLIRAGHAAVADLFCSARLGEEMGMVSGCLPSTNGVAELLERAQPMK